jgi:endonuclease-8
LQDRDCILERSGALRPDPGDRDGVASSLKHTLSHPGLRRLAWDSSGNLDRLLPLSERRQIPIDALTGGHSVEGPSLYLAKQQLRPFKGRSIIAARGNTKAIDPAALVGLTLKDEFAWGKHLVFQFGDFALRFHFLMFGTYEAEIDGDWVTGDYRRTRNPRLSLLFPNGRFNAYSCSIKPIASRNARQGYDRGIDIMSPGWDEPHVRKLLRARGEEEIADALLDQEIFAGVGNIIKNEVLALVHLRPTHRISAIPPAKLREVVASTRRFAKQFYAWRRAFVLRKHLLTHRRANCQYCGGPLKRAKTGKRQRWSYWCETDQH